MEKRNTILLTIIAIATLLVTIIGATFAYFASNINTNSNIAVNVNTSNEQAVFLATSNGELNLSVESYMMQQHDADSNFGETSNNGTIAPMLSKEADLNISLQASDEDKLTSCTYDIVFAWNSDASGNNFSNVSDDSEGIYPSKYYVRTKFKDGETSPETFKELTIEATSTTYDGTSERTTNADAITEKNIDEFEKYKKEEGKILLLGGEEIGNASKDETKKTLINYHFTLKFYNLPTDQSNLMDKNFVGTISVENVVC